ILQLPQHLRAHVDDGDFVRFLARQVVCGRGAYLAGSEDQDSHSSPATSGVTGPGVRMAGDSTPVAARIARESAASWRAGHDQHRVARVAGSYMRTRLA